MVNRIDKPLPVELQDRTAKLLEAIRPADTKEALANTKAIWPLGNSDQIILRIETGCFAERCMTLVGHVREHEIVPMLTLDAGSLVMFNDVLWPVWGSEATPSLFFQGHGEAGLIAILRNQGWAVTACSGCTDWTRRQPDERAEPLPPPPPVPASESFDEFRRKLDNLAKPRG